MAGDDFPNARSLLEALFNLEEDERHGESSGGGGSSLLSTAGGPGCSSGLEGTSSAFAVTSAGPKTTSITSESSEEANSLLEENRMLKEERTCKICMDKESNVVFLPCGHLVCCAECAPAMKNCPICRQTIRGSVRTYLS